LRNSAEAVGLGEAVGLAGAEAAAEAEANGDGVWRDETEGEGVEEGIGERGPAGAVPGRGLHQAMESTMKRSTPQMRAR